MRDIRRDLRERLAEIVSERESLAGRLKHLDDLEATLKTLFQQEELRWKAQQPPLTGLEGVIEPKAAGQSPLGRFLLETLSNGKEWHLVDLVTLANNRGLIAEGKSPRRVIHFSLVGLKQNGIVEMVTSGVWRLKTSGNNQQRDDSDSEL